MEQTKKQGKVYKIEGAGHCQKNNREDFLVLP
jgi:hypothetical protein